MALKHELAGYRSWFITRDHRLVYSCNEGELRAIQGRFQYWPLNSMKPWQEGRTIAKLPEGQDFVTLYIHEVGK